MIPGAFAQRNIDYAGANDLGGTLARFVSRISLHQRPVLGTKGDYSLMQRSARTRVDFDLRLVIGKLHALDGGHGFREFVGVFVHIAAAILHGVVDGVNRFGTGAHGILVGVDLHSVRGHVLHHGELRQRVFVIERE